MQNDATLREAHGDACPDCGHPDLPDQDGQEHYAGCPTLRRTADGKRTADND